MHFKRVQTKFQNKPSDDFNTFSFEVDDKKNEFTIDFFQNDKLSEKRIDYVYNIFNITTDDIFLSLDKKNIDLEYSLHYLNNINLIDYQENIDYSDDKDDDDNDDEDDNKQYNNGKAFKVLSLTGTIKKVIGLVRHYNNRNKLIPFFAELDFNIIKSLYDNKIKYTVIIVDKGFKRIESFNSGNKIKKFKKSNLSKKDTIIHIRKIMLNYFNNLVR